MAEYFEVFHQVFWNTFLFISFVVALAFNFLILFAAGGYALIALGKVPDYPNGVSFWVGLGLAFSAILAFVFLVIPGVVGLTVVAGKFLLLPVIGT